MASMRTAGDLMIFKCRKRPRMNHHTITLDRASGTMLIVKDKGNKPDITYQFEDLRGILKSWEDSTVVQVLTPKGSKEGKNKVVSAMITMGRWKRSLSQSAAKATAGARGFINRATSKSQGVRMGTHAVSGAFGGSYFTDRFSDMVHKLELEFENALTAHAFYLQARWMRMACYGDPYLDMVPTRPHVQPMKVLVGTWNLGNAAPPGSLQPWLPIDAGYDIIAVGSQESQYGPRSPHATCEADWFDAVTQHLGDGYVKVEALSMWEIRLMVFVAVEHIGRVSNVARSSEGVGIGKMMGNKGGVAIAMQVDNTSMCFVTSHLAAHQDKVSKRNEDASSIIRNVKLGNPDFDLTSGYDYLFWSGDLNYRIDLTVEQARSLIKEGDLDKLQGFDQLKVEVEGRRVFYGFTEAPLTFPPTYKYRVGVWDPKQGREYTDEKSRVPSWCDRVLVYPFPGCPVRNHLYRSCDAMVTSDHSPVAAGYDIMVRHLQMPRADQPRGARVQITNMSCNDLTVPRTLKEAPSTFLRFSAWFLEGDTQTAPAAPTPAADGWENYYSAHWHEDMPLYPAISDYLLQEHIVITLGRVRKDESKGIDALGYAILHLEQVGTSGQAVDLTLPLVSSGLNKGELTMTVQVVIPRGTITDKPAVLPRACSSTTTPTTPVTTPATTSATTTTTTPATSPGASNAQGVPPPLPTRPATGSPAAPPPAPATPAPAPVALDLIDFSTPEHERNVPPPAQPASVVVSNPSQPAAVSAPVLQPAPVMMGNPSTNPFLQAQGTTSAPFVPAAQRPPQSQAQAQPPGGRQFSSNNPFANP